MKALIILFSLFFSFNIYSSSFSIDTSYSYSRNLTNSYNSYLGSLGFYYNVFDNVLFSTSIGLEAMRYLKTKEDYGNSLMLVPTFRFKIPFILLKAGLGYSHNSINEGSPTVYLGAAHLYSLGLLSIGLDVKYLYRTSNTKDGVFSVGPILSFGF